MNEKNQKRELRLEMQQNPGSEILKDLKTYNNQDKETLNLIMTTRYGDDWKQQVEQAKKENLKK